MEVAEANENSEAMCRYILPFSSAYETVSFSGLKDRDNTYHTLFESFGNYIAVDIRSIKAFFVCGVPPPD